MLPDELKLSSLARKFAEKLCEAGYRVKEKGGKLIGEKEGKTLLIYWRDVTGPVTKRMIDTAVGDEDYDGYALMFMGFLTKQTIAKLIKDSKFKGKTIVFEAGLKDYMDTKLKPKILKIGKRGLFDVLMQTLSEFGLKASRHKCDYCERPLVTVCNVCGKFLCHTHMIICPICRQTFCHPDTGMNCFSKHKCN